MRVKTYIAPSVPEAMDQIRKDFGSGVVILANQRTLDGVRITIGIEDTLSEQQVTEALYGDANQQILDGIERALIQNSVPSLLIERILSVVSHKQSGLPASDLLTQAFEDIFQFSPLSLSSAKKAYMLVGPYGCGKTIAVAKLAFKAKIEHKKTTVITTDVKRAGAIEQLEAFTKILELPLIKVRKPDLLKNTIEQARIDSDLIFIDSPGINPFLQKDIALLQEAKDSIDGLETLLVLSAGYDAYESAQMAECFLPLGCSRLMATHLDLSSRLGNILFAAQNNGYALTDVSIGANVSEGLCPLKAATLAELILLKIKKEGVL